MSTQSGTHRSPTSCIRRSGSVPTNSMRGTYRGPTSVPAGRRTPVTGTENDGTGDRDSVPGDGSVHRQRRDRPPGEICCSGRVEAGPHSGPRKRGPVRNRHRPVGSQDRDGPRDAASGGPSPMSVAARPRIAGTGSHIASGDSPLSPHNPAHRSDLPSRLSTGRSQSASATRRPSGTSPGTTLHHPRPTENRTCIASIVSTTAHVAPHPTTHPQTAQQVVG